jgi:hypothetical protein
MSVAESGHEAQASERGRFGGESRFGFPRWEHTRHEVLEVWIGSECRRRSKRISIATPTSVNSARGNARPSSNDERPAVTRGGHREDERTGAKASAASPTHGDVPVSKRTRASRVGVEADAVRIRRLGKSFPGLRARTIETSSGCLVRGRSLPKPERRGRAPGSRVKDGRTSKGLRTELAVRHGTQRRCS